MSGTALKRMSEEGTTIVVQIKRIQVTIDRIDAENWLGVTDGLDVGATVEQYADRATVAIQQAFPGTVVGVYVDYATQHYRIPIIVETDEEFGYYTERDADQSEIETVKDILTDVYTGRYGEYLVEA